MKRLLSTLLCAVLVMAALVGNAGAAASGYAVAGVTAVTISGDEAYVNTVAANDAGTIAALKALLDSAKTPVKKPANAQEVAQLHVTSTTGNTDTPHTFVLYRSGKSYILSRGTQNRRVAYSTFNDLVNAIGTQKVYLHATAPTPSFATFGGKGEWSQSAQMKYRRMSGKYNTVFYDAPDVPVEITTNGAVVPTFSRATDTSAVIIRKGAQTVFQGTLKEAAAYSLPGAGKYYVGITLSENNLYAQGSYAYSYNLNYQDGVQFSVEGGDTHLGEVVVLRVTGTTAADPLATFTSDISLNLPPKFHRLADGSQIALFPISYRNTAGSHWIEIKCGDRSQRFSITAGDKQWQIQNLTVDSTTSSETINSQRANDEYEQVIAPLRSVADDKQHWSGRFILPCSDQKVTTQFGMIRYLNGQPTSTRHGAIDLAVPRGTEVKATGAGRVLYAGYLQLTGNTVLIEHGYGLKSWYYHMDSFAVEAGQMVAQGQRIGAVGSTGFSTGPHLHFGMSVNNVFINPYTAINTDLLT